MSKLLVACDEYVYSYNGKYYVRQFGNVLLNRYLNVFEEVRFAIRVKKVISVEELEAYIIPVSDTRVEIFPIPFFQGLIQNMKIVFQSRRLMKNVAKLCDAAIFRLPSTTAFVCFWSLKKQKTPYAVEVVANPFEMAKNSSKFSDRLVWIIIHILQRMACKKARGVSYVTEQSLQKIYSTNKNAFQTHYSSIALDDAFYYKERNIDYNKRDIVISHISLDINTFSKGHQDVILIVRKLHDKGFNVKVKFAGNGNYVDLFKQMAEKLKIQEYVEFVGSLNSNQIRQLLLESNIMVFPSSSEGLPRVLIEAMATGLPCLATPVGGIPEIIDNNLLFKVNDIEGYTQKIIEIFTEKGLYEKISEDNFNKSLEFRKDVLDRKRKEFFLKLKQIAH